MLRKPATETQKALFKTYKQTKTTIPLGSLRSIDGDCIVKNIHSFIFAINHIQIKQQYTEIYNTLKIIYTILTKLFTKLNVLSGNDKEAYIEVGGS